MEPIYHESSTGSGIERLADGAVDAFQNGRVRLWLADLNEKPDLIADLGRWVGVVGSAAQSHAAAWEPNRDELLGRLAGRAPTSQSPLTASEAVQELLPLAREDFRRTLESQQVPENLAQKAELLLSIRLPVQQWKM